ncbi:MAG TPA: DMT family transporter [Candidatus Sulfotelmatobacter sp.]|nr:DMT family transporter [Candidatus Sulfotelmatobacter sp.]
MSAAPGQVRGVAAMVGATLLWGATFVVIRDSLHALDPGALVFGRFAVAAVLLGLLMARRRAAPPRELFAVAVISGLLYGACYLLQAIGLTATSAGSSAFLTCAGSMFAGLFAWPVLGQRPGRTLLAGLALALAGAALLSLDSRFRLGWGEAVTMAGALCYGLGVAWVGRLAGRVDPVALATVQSAAVALMLSPRAALAVRQLAALSPAGWARFGYLALAGSVLAPLLQLRAQQTLSPGRVGLLLALEPVFALIFAVTAGGERFVARWWAGAALILFAVLEVERRSSREPSSPPAATPRTAA